MGDQRDSTAEGAQGLEAETGDSAGRWRTGGFSPGPLAAGRRVRNGCAGAAWPGPRAGRGLPRRSGGYGDSGPMPPAEDQRPRVVADHPHQRPSSRALVRSRRAILCRRRRWPTSGGSGPRTCAEAGMHTQLSCRVRRSGGRMLQRWIAQLEEPRSASWVKMSFAVRPRRSRPGWATSRMRCGRDAVKLPERRQGVAERATGLEGGVLGTGYAVRIQPACHPRGRRQR